MGDRVLYKDQTVDSFSQSLQDDLTGQVNLKFQFPMTETKFWVNSDSNPHLVFPFWISNVGHCVLFVICYLVLGISQVQGFRHLDINR